MSGGELGHSIGSSFLGGGGTTRSERAKVPLAPGKSLYDWLKRANAMPPVNPATMPSFTRDEVLRHNTPGDVWTIFQGHVFDLTEYMEYHPGGAEQLMRAAGRDMTALFVEVHAWVNMSLLKPCLKGKLRDPVAAGGSTMLPGGASLGLGVPRAAPPMNLRCRLESFERLTDDTVALEFSPVAAGSSAGAGAGAGAAAAAPAAAAPATAKPAESSAASKASTGTTASVSISLPAASTMPPPPASLRAAASSSQSKPAAAAAQFDVGIGQHLSLRGVIRGRNVNRPYTPIGDPGSSGRLRLLVKIYDDGAMSQHLAALRVGDEIGHTVASGEFPSLFSARIATGKVTHLGMVGAGTGITPFPRLWRAASKIDKVESVRLVTVNRTRADVLLRDEIEAERAARAPQFDAAHCITREDEAALLLNNNSSSNSNDEAVETTTADCEALPPQWIAGRFTEDVARKHLPPPGPGTLVCVCGPVLMVKASVSILVALGFTADMIFEFV
jgi:cytochrome-b5 reductase